MATLKARIQSLELQSKIVGFELGDIRHSDHAIGSPSKPSTPHRWGNQLLAEGACLL